MQSKLSEAVPVGSEETLQASFCSSLLGRGYLEALPVPFCESEKYQWRLHSAEAHHNHSCESLSEFRGVTLASAVV